MSLAPPRRRLLAAAAAVVVAFGLVTACTATTAGRGAPAAVPGLSPSSEPSEPDGSTDSTGTPRFEVEAIDFEDCTDRIRPQLADDQPLFDRLRFGCGFLPVPMDHQRPGLGTVDIAVLRLRIDTQTAGGRIGSLVINPGGPGGSGVSASLGIALDVSPELLESFDLVGFDPRGVGESAPIECISASTKDELMPLDYDIRVPAQFASAKARAADLAEGCARTYPDLRHVTTEATARDLDLLRQGLGDERLSYLGYSYGTLLGAVYAHLFPGRVRVAVLDGAVDPAMSGLAATQFQLAGFEQAFDQFAAYCRADAACSQMGDPRAAVIALQAAATASPIPSDDARRDAGGGTVILAAGSALYAQDTWPDLRDALLDARSGDGTGLIALADAYNGRRPDGSYGNLMDANLAINCNDSAVDPADAQILQSARAWATQYPLFGLNFAQGLFACQSWQPDRTPITSVAAPGAPPILVIGTVHDPATPYAGAQQLADQLTVGVVLTWQGEGHTAYPQTPCIQEIVDEYLMTAIPPAPGAECPA